ncbi:MAG: hypothetical protein SOX50_14400 [Terrisporobacter othiniensis]|uniref:hypothetical protein n=1 Tax=Terrisporobacter othiniensis TaxID=1577792 RepID=UPI002A75FE1A|nr:hypothetical protein [Terrisporobacter othiniensis]MDY3374451.1 hypothetical protein [Terrisporobacter othiniensis]
MKYIDSSNLDKVMESYSYTYDVDNRLSTSITVNGTKEVVNQENLYNGNGKRIQKKEGNNVVNYFYQDGVVLSTSDKDGNKTEIQYDIFNNDEAILTKITDANVSYDISDVAGLQEEVQDIGQLNNITTQFKYKTNFINF